MAVKTRFDSARLQKAVMRKLARNMRSAVDFLRDEVVASLDRRAGGASQPGETPASQSGALARSITSDVEVSNNGVTGRVTAEAEHARALEFGTPRMAARPFLRPALLKNRRALMKLLGKS